MKETRFYAKDTIKKHADTSVGIDRIDLEMGDRGYCRSKTNYREGRFVLEYIESWLPRN